MARNKRVLYSAHAPFIKGDGVASYTAVKGAQQVSKTTTFDLIRNFQLGQLAIYELSENIPTVEGTVSKLLDGNPLIWTLASVNATAPTLIARAAEKFLLGIAIWPETNTAATGLASSEVEISGAFASSLSYTFPVEGSFTEEIGYTANNLVWANDPRMVQASPWSNSKTLSITGTFSDTDVPVGSGGVNKRQNLIFSYAPGLGLNSAGFVNDPDCTVLPTEIDGISASGTNELSGGYYTCSVQNISVGAQISRGQILQLGRKTPYDRPAQFPIEITLGITTITASGDMISATDAGILSATSNACSNNSNTANQMCRIATCEGTRIYLGNKLRLQSAEQSGGNAGDQDNVQTTYNYLGFNTMTVLHSGDTNALGATWWSARSTHLNP